MLTFTKLSKNKGEIIKFAEQLGNGSTRFYLNESTIPDFENLKFNHFSFKHFHIISLFSEKNNAIKVSTLAQKKKITQHNFIISI